MDTYELAPRRGSYVDLRVSADDAEAPLSAEELRHFETLDLVYRSLCALMFNYVPMSGHPGGSISSGRMVAGVLFDAMDYDLTDPDRPEADMISYAAGHKAMGLYAMWALRDEVARLAAPDLLPDDVRLRLRLEDLLGFRRNPVNRTPLFEQFGSKPLDGHPTPATPFVKLSTGASGVGVASSLGLAFAARDYYGAAAPRLHIVEGEGGLTPGRVAEALAAAGTAIARQRHPASGLESGLHRLQPGLPRQRPARRLRAVEPDGAVPAARLERGLRPRRPRSAAGDRRPAARPGAEQRPAHRRSSTARSRAGSTASRARPRTAPATSCARTASAMRWAT